MEIPDAFLPLGEQLQQIQDRAEAREERAACGEGPKKNWVALIGDPTPTTGEVQGGPTTAQFQKWLAESVDGVDNGNQ